jgi:hypothetical protein
VSYPSYEATTAGLGKLAAVEGLPTTVYIDSVGKVTYVHSGEYDAQGNLEQDIETYALGR